MNLPNLLTFLRILLIPAVVGSFFVNGKLGMNLAFGFFVLAGITDFFDGYLARAMGQQSKLGTFLDPVADKLLVASALMMLVASGRIFGLNVLPAIVILCREILVSGLQGIPRRPEGQRAREPSRQMENDGATDCARRASVG